MKKLLVVALGLCIAFSANAQKKKKEKQPEVQAAPAAAPAPAWPKLANAQDSASYAYGIVLGNSLTRQLNNDNLNRELVIKAIISSLNKDTMPFDQESAGKIYTTYNKANAAKANEKAKAEGEAYLAKNKMRPGVTTTASGLQYEILKPASSVPKKSEPELAPVEDLNKPTTPPLTKPIATSRVTVHYVGTTIDGVEFDSSVKRGKPAEFGLNQVIAGWTEGLQLMTKGEKARFVIPYNLAYGERGNQGIKPFSTLIFEVELIDIK
jgi:FKBP-type peptidyl-prolyl cis-trans isomerase FklB